MYGIFCTIQDITSSLYDIKQLFLGHHTHYVWHCIHCICVLTSTVLMMSHQLYLCNLIRYIWWHHIHCKRHHIHYICNITTTVSGSSHPFFRWYHTLCMYDITPTVCITSYMLYKASHPHFMTSHHIICDSTCTVLMTSPPRYLTLHLLYLCHHNHSSDDFWPIFLWCHTHCMTLLSPQECRIARCTPNQLKMKPISPSLAL